MEASLIFYLFVFFLGLVIGSFLNCVIFRLEKQKSLGGRSFCPNCGHILCWYDLIPVFSFLFLRGRCRYCRQKISWQYFFVELTTGLVFLSVFIFSPQDTDFIRLGYFWLISSFLIIIFVYDLKHYIIPDKIIYPAILIALIYNLFFTGSLAFVSFYCALGGAAFFGSIFLFSKGKWMGFGDAKLAFLMGLFLGFPEIIVALFLAFFIGAIIGIGLIISRRKHLKSEMPFGPFLVTGAFLSLFFGEKIINWYLGLFL